MWSTRKAVESPREFALPDLLPKLLPGVVTVTELTNNGYRLEGDHLRAVEAVRLESAGSAVVRDVSVGLNNVDFYLPTTPQNAVYNVFLVIGNMSVPALKIDPTDKKLHQVVVPIPAKK